MSVKIIRICDTCGAEHEFKGDVYANDRLILFMNFECSDCLMSRVLRQCATSEALEEKK